MPSKVIPVGYAGSTEWITSSDSKVFSALNRGLELRQTEDNVSRAVIAPPIVSKELMYALMLKKDRILCVLLVWAVVFVLLYAPEVF